MCVCSDSAPRKRFVQFCCVDKTRGESIAKAIRECLEDKVSFEGSSLGAGWVSQASFTYAETSPFPNYTTAEIVFLAFLLLRHCAQKIALKHVKKRSQ